MKKLNNKFAKRMMAAFVSVCVVFGSVNITAFAADPPTKNYTTVADASTAQNYESMLGTDVDGNRYAGRVWADKSVYTAASVDVDGAGGEAAVENDDDFMVVYSAIGSSTAVSTETVTESNLDVVMVLDLSSSMTTDRMNAVVNAANGLMNKVLESQNNRVAVVGYHNSASTLLDLNHYDHAQGRTNILSYSGSTVTARTTLGTETISKGYGTNQQSGIAMGMAMLANQSPANVKGRTPVVIVLTDGASNYAVTSDWWDYNENNKVQTSDYSATSGLILSTLLNASYMKSAVNKVYERKATVYGISVDLTSTNSAYAIMNPSEVFHAGNTDSVMSTAWKNYQSWINTDETIRLQEGRRTWVFAQLGTNTYNVSKQEVISNIHYVDTHFNVGSQALGDIFQQIYTEINTPAFNPITDTVDMGGYAEAVPFTYVDFIGEYMEVKDFKQVSLFGKSYQVTESLAVAPQVFEVVNLDGTLTRTTTTTYNVGVGAAAITHPVFKSTFSIADCVTIELVDECQGYKLPDNSFVKTGVSKQTVWVYITEDALPIILSEVDVNVTGGNTTTLYTETEEDPIRLYYTVGISNDVKDAGTDHVNLSLVDAAYVEANTVTLPSGEKQVQFYSNRYGNMNTTDAAGDLFGDAHVSFTASEQNRYYYHQNNYPIFSKLTDPTTGQPPVIDESEWGVLYHEHDTTQPYELTWMTWADAAASQSDTETQVFTVVGFYREDARTADTTDGDDVAYMAYSTWQELRFSTVFAYVENADQVGNNDPSASTAKPTYLNWENGQIVESTVAGYAVTEDSTERAQYIEAVKNYVNGKQGWSLDDVYAYLAIGSKRLTRLHNMTNDKTANMTNTANVAYAPTYNENTEHAGGIVIWLGNNGLLSVTPDEPPTSLQISKTATDANTEATFTFEIKDTTNTALAETYNAVLTDSTGEAQTTVKFTNGAATVELKHGQSILIEELPIGDTLTVEETGKGKYNLQSVTANGEKIAAGTELATVNLVAGHTATVDFVNEPKEYGSLSIVKEITHNLGTNPPAMSNLTFTIQVDLGADAAHQTFTYAKAEGGVTDTKTADGNGILEFVLKNGQEVVIYGLEEGTIAKVKEPNPGTGFTASYWVNSVQETGTQATATIVADATQVVVVENTYDPTYTGIHPGVLLSGTKQVTGIDWTTEVFTIVLEKYVYEGGQWKWVPLAEVDLKKDAPSFSATMNTAIYTAMSSETYTQPGTYAYRLREVNYGETIDGWTYDATLHTFDVVVVDNAMNGQLAVDTVKCTHTGDNHFVQTGNLWLNPDMNFTNTYDADGTTVTLHLQKEIDNVAKSALASREGFQFGLYDSTGALKYQSELTDASGEALIQIPYDYIGTQTYPYTETYTLKEIVPNPKKAGYIYDTTDYEVEITLKNNSGKVEAEYTINELQNQNPITFTNKYEPTGTWQFTANKSLIGRAQPLQAEEFDFQMDWTYYRDPAEAAPEAKTEDIPLTTKNAADGKITFDTISFNQVGVYFYEVSELAGNKGGVKYDGKTHTVRVEVTDNNGVLVANAIVLDNVDNAVTFTNTYTPQPVQVELKATKTLTGRSTPLKDREFIFGLVDANPDGSRVTDAVPVYATNTDSGDVVFTKTYDKAGEYYYRMREASTDGKGVTVDTARYVYRVVVTDNNEGVLSYQISFRNENEEVWVPVNGDIVGAAFVNTYKASGAVTIPGMKQLIGKDLEAEKFSFGLHEATVGAQGIEIGRLVTSVFNETDGAFEFTIPYTELSFQAGEEKTFIYAVHEKQDVVYDYIDYDTTQYLVEVTVTDNGDGTLKAVPKITLEGRTEEFAGVAFYNVYNGPGIEVEKTQAVGPNATYTDANTESLAVKEGDIITYFITVTNYDVGYAKNVVIEDEIPKGLTLIEDSISDGGTVKDGVITWKFDKLEGGTRGVDEEITPNAKTVSFQVSVPKVEKDTAWKNVATVTFNYPEDEQTTPPTEQDTNEVTIEEKAPEKVPENPPETPKEPTAPKTGDAANTAMWSTFAFASLMVCGVILLMERDKRRE